MAESRPLHLFLIGFLVLHAGIQSVHADKCSTGCTSSNSLFQYQVGQTYQYALDSTVSVLLTGSDTQETALKIHGTVLISQLPNCDQLLRLQNVVVQSPDNKKHPGLDDITKPVRFNFNDGKVDAQICAEPGDNQNSLNIKRAIISLFQASRASTETDVFGVCPTHVSTNKEGAEYVVTKIRALNDCAHRESIQQGFLTTTFNDNSAIKSSPLLTGEYSSEQRFKDGILDKVSVTENYQYKPFSPTRGGARSHVVTKLTFVKKTAEAPGSRVSKPRTIIFENPHLVPVGTNSDNIINVLRQTVKHVETHVDSASARDFTNLIRVLRVSNKADMLNVYGQVNAGAGFKDKSKAKKVFLDGLFRTGTGDSVEVVVELILHKKLSEKEQKLAFLSFANAKHVTAASLNAVADLLEKSAPREALLGIGILAGHYCREHSCSGNELQKLSDSFAKKLGNCSPRSRDEEDTILAALKGLRNTHKLTSTAVDKVASCIKSQHTPIRIRVAALETIQGVDCEKKLTREALSILQNRDLDSELRIEAYLALVQCPTAQFANDLKNLLDTETVNQVGSFITSHLNNLRASTNPHKELAKQHLGLVHSTKRFPIDFRRYSSNSEFSYSVDALGLGASIENNVIYSQKSFLPRSGSLNLTGELFGHSFNLLELSARQENLDLVIEHYFGPKGVFSGSSPQEIYDKAKSTVDELKQQYKDRLDSAGRGKRATKQEVDAFQHKNTEKYNSKLDLDLDIKMFGSELFFLSLGDKASHFSPQSLVNELFDHLEKGIDAVKNFKHNVHGNVMFLDVEVAYPTSVGIPLKVSVTGTGTLKVETSGHIDVKRIMKDPKNASFKFLLVPSANIEVIGALTVDAQVVSTGLEVVGNLHSSTGTDIIVNLLNNGNGIDIKVGLPLEKQEIFSVNHKILFSTQERGHPAQLTPLKFNVNKKAYKGCFDQLSPYIGLTFCGDADISLPLPAEGGLPFPLNGPSKLSLSIEKEDLHQYHFRLLKNIDDPKHRTLEVLFDTPNSKTKRTISFNVDLVTEPNKVLKVVLASPIRSASLEAKLIQEEKEVGVSVSFKNGDEEYFGKIGAHTSGPQERRLYKPLIEFRSPQSGGDSSYHVEGQLLIEKGDDWKKYHYQGIEVSIPGQPPVRIDGFLNKKGEHYEVDCKVSQDNKFISYKGQWQIGPGFNGKISDWEMHNSYNPDFDFRLSYEYGRNEDELKHHLILVHGRDLNSNRNRFELDQQLKYTAVGTSNFDVSLKNLLTYPAAQLNLKLDGGITKKKAEYKLEASDDKSKLYSHLKALCNTKHAGDYDVDFKTQFNEHYLVVKSKRNVLDDAKSTYTFNVDTSNGGKLDVAGTVTLNSPKDYDTNFKGSLQIPGKSNKYNAEAASLLNERKIKSYLKVSADNVLAVDFDVDVDRSQDPKGSFKLNVKDLLNAKSEFNSAQGKGSGSALVDFIKLNRKVKGETTFNIVAPVYNVDANIYYDAEKDNSKKIHFSTNNELRKGLKSNNVLAVGPHETKLNFNGEKTGTFTSGTFKGQFDCTLPNGYYFEGKLDRDVKQDGKSGSGEGEIHLSFAEKKGAPAYKYEAKTKVLIEDFAKHLVDYSGSVLITVKDKKFWGYNGLLKHSSDGAHGYKFDGAVTIDAAFIEKTLDYKTTVQYGTDKLKYDVQCQYGQACKLIAHGDLAKSEGGSTNKFVLQGDFNNEQFKHFRFEHDSAVKRPKGEHDDYEFTVTNSATYNDKTVKGNGFLKGNKHKGSVKATVELPNEAPFSLGANYEHNEKKDAKQCKVGFDVTYAQNKQVRLNAIINLVPDSDLDVHLILNTPVEHARNVDLKILHKKQKESHASHTELTLQADQRSYGAIVDLDLIETAPSLDVQFVYPEGKKSRLLSKFERLGERKGNGEIRIESIYDFNFVGTGSANCEEVDNCLIKVHLDSAKLNLDNVDLVIESKKGGSGHIVEVSAKSGDKNIVSGSTTFQRKQEQGKYIVEGSGTITVKETPHAANFKYMYNQVRESNEKGLQIVLNAGYGQKNVVVDLKLTNKQFSIANSYCEPKQECAHVDLSSKINKEDINELDHELEVSVDLRKLGLSHEFGLKATTHLRDLVLDHTVDMHFHSQDKSKYQYSVYVHPKNAGVTLTLPQRVIAIEGVLDIPRPNTIGPVNGQLSLYLNKAKEPNHKTSLELAVNPTYSNKKAAVQAHLKFLHPGVKTMAISGNANLDGNTHSGNFHVKLDVFDKAAQSIEVEGTYNNLILGGRGINITAEINVFNKERSLDFVLNEHVAITDKEFGVGSLLQCRHDASKSSGFLVTANLRQFELLVRSPYGDLVHVNSKLDLHEKHQKVESDVKALGIPPMKYTLEVKDYNTVKYTAGRQDNPQKFLQLVSSLILGKAGEVRAEIIEGGSRKDLFHSTVLLDDANFLKTDYAISTENIKAHIQHIRSEAQQAGENLKKTLQTVADDLQARVAKYSESFKTYIPDLKPLIDDYQRQLLQIKDELLADKSIKEFTDFLNKIFGATIQAISELVKSSSERFEKINVLIKDLYTKVTDLLNKQIIPKLRESYTKIADVCTDLFQTIFNYATDYLLKFTDWIQSHRQDFDSFAKTVSDFLRDFGKHVNRGLIQFRDELEEFIKFLYQNIASTPILETLKEKYEEMVVGVTVPEHVYQVLAEVVSGLKDILPTPELREALQEVYKYLEQKLKQEPVDDVHELKSIYSKIISAVKSLLKLVQDNLVTEPPTGFLGFPIPVTFGGLQKIPDLTTLRLSPLNFLRYNRIPTYEELQAIVRPLTLNPLSLLPPFPMRGYIADGQHIFTFDRRHLTFPGSCSYVLAQDFVDKNFTIVANLQNGVTKSLTLADKTDVIEITDQGVVTLNGAPSELPAHKNDLHAWRRFHTVTLLTKYGVFIRCNNDLSLCSFEVNGFYLGKLHGLLGNGNSEPYDDFKLPSGVISKKESEFGNAYKLQDSCPDVSAPEHHDHEHHHGAGGATCDYFSGNSRLRPCFPFVDPAPFRQACQHATSASKNPKEAACSIAQIYAASCKNEWIPVSAPKECGKCEKNIAVGDPFSVKVPAKQADIIFVIETEPVNNGLIKELFHPLLNQLLNDLKARGITDTHVAVIGFNENQKYPALFTSGGKINFRGKPGTVKAIVDDTDDNKLKTGEEKVDEWIEKISKLIESVKYEFGLTSAYAAYDDAMDYPFRAGATKTIIGIHGTNVKPAKLPFQSLRFYVASKLAEYQGITYNVVAPIDLKTNGVDEKTIVGFNSDVVFTTADAKKKSPGNSELRSKVHHSYEPSVDLALKGYGNVYSVQNFQHAKAQKQNKNYISVISNSLVDQITRTEIHSDCVCVLKEGLFPVSHCVVTQRKFLPAAKVQKAARG